MVSNLSKVKSGYGISLTELSSDILIYWSIGERIEGERNKNIRSSVTPLKLKYFNQIHF